MNLCVFCIRHSDERKRKDRRTEVLNDVLVFEVFEELDLALERVDHAPLAVVVHRAGQLDLLDGHEEAVHRVHAEVDAAEGAGADEGAANPLDTSFACE